MKVHLIGSLVSPDVYVDGLGTIGTYSSTHKEFRKITHKNHKSNELLDFVPDTIECSRNRVCERIARLIAQGLKAKQDANKKD
jgi:hypothetical protein